MLPVTPEQPCEAGLLGPPVVRLEPRLIIRAREPPGEAAEPSAEPPVTQTSSRSVTLRRPEPRVIIKATSTTPVRPSHDYGTAQSPRQAPHVHMQPEAGRAPALDPTTTPDSAPSPTRPPTIAPKPSLKRTQQCTSESDPKTTAGRAVDGQQHSSPPADKCEDATASPQESVAPQSPPAPPPMPRSPQKQRHGCNNRTAAGASKQPLQSKSISGKDSSAQGVTSNQKTGTIKRGKRK